MKNIAKSLKPGGKAVLYVSLSNEFHVIVQDEFNKIITTPTWNYYKDVLRYNNFLIPTEEWFEYAEQNNFEIVNFEMIQDTIIYETYDQFKQRFTVYGLGAEIVQVMGQELSNSFIDCYLENVYKALGLTINEPIVRVSDGLILILKK